jgi:hypothetical protein
MISQYFPNGWIKVLDQELPKGIIVFNFNLYEVSDRTYDIQLIGSDEFDENDGDWACSDYYTSGEDSCYIKRTKEIEQWEQALSFITKLAEQYLIEGRNANILKSASAIEIGFVDGDIEIIYRA